MAFTSSEIKLSAKQKLSLMSQKLLRSSANDSTSFPGLPGSQVPRYLLFTSQGAGRDPGNEVANDFRESQGLLAM